MSEQAIKPLASASVAADPAGLTLCPFCGSPGAIARAVMVANQCCHAIECLACSARGPVKLARDEAWEEWGARHATDLAALRAQHKTEPTDPVAYATQAEVMTPGGDDWHSEVHSHDNQAPKYPPCPFCGAEAAVEGIDEKTRIFCSNDDDCPCGETAFTVVEWERRTPAHPPATPDAVASPVVAKMIAQLQDENGALAQRIIDLEATPAQTPRVAELTGLLIKWEYERAEADRQAIGARRDGLKAREHWQASKATSAGAHARELRAALTPAAHTKREGVEGTRVE